MHSGHCHSQKVIIGRKWYSLIQLYTYKRLKGILNRKTLKLSYLKEIRIKLKKNVEDQEYLLL